MSYISRWVLLVSVILQISNLEAILYSGHFFDTPCICLLAVEPLYMSSGFQTSIYK